MQGKYTLYNFICAFCEIGFSSPDPSRKYCSVHCYIESQKSTPSSFWSRVNKSDVLGACWLWTGPSYHDGYGCIKWHGRTIMAHQVAYKIAYGSIPDGLDVLHKCDNPPCCNPLHLFAGTHADNMKDMVVKGRNSRGENHHSAKLTHKQVMNIRSRYSCGNIRGIDLAVEYGVTPSAIYGIVHNVTWRE